MGNSPVHALQSKYIVEDVDQVAKPEALMGNCKCGHWERDACLGWAWSAFGNTKPKQRPKPIDLHRAASCG